MVSTRNINYIPAAAMLGLSLLAMVVTGHNGSGSIPWLVLHTAMLFSTVYYAIADIFSERWARSTMHSWGYFIVMLVVMYVAAEATAGVKMKDLPQYQKFLVLLIIFKVLLTGLAGLYRFFLDTLKNNG